ncbi:MAG: hypothetical protein J5I47_01870 [Vicingus serpentipes]|nr:hypothetical protein [Vicingus serpentipes]
MKTLNTTQLKQTNSAYNKSELIANKVALAEKIQLVRMQADFLRIKLNMQPLNNY